MRVEEGRREGECKNDEEGPETQHGRGLGSNAFLAPSWQFLSQLTESSGVKVFASTGIRVQLAKEGKI